MVKSIFTAWWCFWKVPVGKTDLSSHCLLRIVWSNIHKYMVYAAVPHVFMYKMKIYIDRALKCQSQPQQTAFWNIFFYYYFSEKIRLSISCESSARQMIHMKCWVLSSLKNNDNRIIRLWSVTILLGALRVNVPENELCFSCCCKEILLLKMQTG